MSIDILITGTGMFAGRIVLDIAATAKEPVTVMVAGRNVDRLDWLRTAGNARARMFGTPAQIVTQQIDLINPGASAHILEVASPKIVVQAASVQTSAVIAQTGNRWTSLVAEGGLSATAIFQALLTSRMAAAISTQAPDIKLINCSFPDVVNGMITAMGHSVLCGTGNVAILSNVFDSFCTNEHEPIRVLAHYQNLAPWRRPVEQRSGARPPRVFLGKEEVSDVFTKFNSARLTPEPAIEISGASGVTLILALAAGRDWHGHAPGPNGLPGGYPVRLESGIFDLDLPVSVSKEEAVAWNASFESNKGLTVCGNMAHFNGRLAQLLSDVKFSAASGFDVRDIEEVHNDFARLRDQLMATAIS